MAVIGENGSGKSTLMKLLSRLNLATSGTFTQDGNIADLAPHTMWRQTSVVPPDFAGSLLLPLQAVPAATTSRAAMISPVLVACRFGLTCRCGSCRCPGARYVSPP
ncbi:hypothetical protein SHKM778_28670 [Streptomyces sp. KM77-8]|uniref:ABC transporter domain-containing protein n=1 Tax=Streptomyces haneummycinicus TaxID=3074435 RepID=A0AAT9HGD3_9ACTN